jgi:hypothetical protein
MQMQIQPYLPPFFATEDQMVATALSGAGMSLLLRYWTIDRNDLVVESFDLVAQCALPIFAYFLSKTTYFSPETRQSLCESQNIFFFFVGGIGLGANIRLTLKHFKPCLFNLGYWMALDFITSCFKVKKTTDSILNHVLEAIPIPFSYPFLAQLPVTHTFVLMTAPILNQMPVRTITTLAVGSIGCVISLQKASDLDCQDPTRLTSETAVSSSSKRWTSSMHSLILTVIAMMTTYIALSIFN